MATKEDIKKDIKREYTYAVGRRKTASVRVRLFQKGTGKITVNGKDFKEFYPFDLWQMNVLAPFETVGEVGKFDAEIITKGGGKPSGSEACRLGISRCLVKINEDWKPLLRAEGFMTRDPRSKERKKPGLKKARRAPQWSKR